MKRARPPPALTTTDKDRKIDTPPTDGSKRQFGEKDNATAVDESSRQVATLYDELDDPSSDETDDG